jgi:uncharacterized protein (DUF885 family)
VKLSNDNEALVDEAWALHVELDDHTPMWSSPVEQIERWPSTSLEATAAVVSRSTAMRERLLTAARDAPVEDLPTLRTAADAFALLAANADVEVELALPHPELGWQSYLHWSTNSHALVTPEHGDGFVAKVVGMAPAIDDLRTRLVEAAQGDRAPLARHTRRALEKLDAQLSAPVAEDPLLRQAPPRELVGTAADAWRDRVTDALRDHARPALQRLRDTLAEASLPHGRGDDLPGLAHRPGGEATYAALVAGNTLPGMTPERVHEIGLQQLARVDEDWARLGPGVLGTSDPAEVRRRLRADASLRHTSAASVVEAATALHARAQEVAPAWFRRTPTSACDVRAVEHGSLAFYSPPTADGSRSGTFYFNTSDPTDWGASLASTVFHEGIPGHHFQLALAVEDTTLHDLHRELFLSAFGEGWALYVERVADDMGLYRDDVDRLGMLATDAMRAVRLVVDTGLHHLGWSRQHAIDTMVDATPLSVGQVTAEIDRYIGMPGQATSYMLGRLEIERLRDEAAARLGDAFDLQGFHDVVLSRGMLSLPALADVVGSWHG